jgi:glucose/arabinose dehydrogenase
MRPSSRALAMLVFAVTAACEHDRITPTSPKGAASAAPNASVSIAAVPGATTTVTVTVPPSMRTSPFNVTRTLDVPTGFNIAVHARVSEARFIALAPNGDLFVSRPGSGTVSIVRPNQSGDPRVLTYVSGLRRPHDIVFATVGGVSYVYIAETHQINRFRYTPGDSVAGTRQVIITGLPDATTPGLGGQYGHQLKNIALDGAGRIYVSIASTGNISVNDLTANPVRAAIHLYDQNGQNRRVYARGVRNAEGLALAPGTSQLWIVVNNRDQIPYPFNDGTGNYGRVFAGYVDDHPPEEFIKVRDGGNYGWPYCNPNPNTPVGYDNMPFDLDYDTNRNGTVNCATMDRVTKGIQAHSAPLGLTFLVGTQFPTPYRDGVVIPLHGSWNRSVKTGYKLAFFSWDLGTQMPTGPAVDLVRGWVVGNSSWGRPVDAAIDPSGAMYISDDMSGTIYKLTGGGPSNQPPVANFTIACNAVNHSCTLDAGASTDDGGLANLTFTWTAAGRPTKTGRVITRFMLEQGPNSHQETLTARDAGGLTHSVTKTVTIP